MRLSYTARNPAGARHIFLLSALSLSVGAATALLPADRVEMRLICAGTGLVLFLLLESFALRFTAVSFRYEIHEKEFRIIRTVRKREKAILSFPLSEIRAMYPAHASPVRPGRNACPTLRGKRITGTVILYGKEDGTRAVVVEYPYSFARALSREAVSAQSGPPDAPASGDPL